MIEYKDQARLKRWFQAFHPLEHTNLLVCLGNVGDDGRIRGVVGYDWWTGTSCEMHIAGLPGWITRQFIWAAFDYPFNQARCKVVLGRISSGDRVALGIALRLGFVPVCTVPDVFPDGSLELLRMRRDECRWLRSEHVEEPETAACA